MFHKGLSLALILGVALLAGFVGVASGKFTATRTNNGNTLAATTLAAPTGFTATASGLLASQINLSWTAPALNAQGTGTQIWRSAAGGGGTFTKIATVSPGSATTYTATGLSALTKYCFYAITVDSNWTSAQTPQSCATTIL
jgi:hypothetical protein